jgi:hypothetical protein
MILITMKKLVFDISCAPRFSFVISLDPRGSVFLCSSVFARARRPGSRSGPVIVFFLPRSQPEVRFPTQRF